MNTNVTTSRQKADFVICFNRQEMSLEHVLLSTAKKKAHNMVRDYLRHKYIKEKEVTAKILLQDNCVSEIHGFRKCGLGAINIIHSDSPDTNRYRLL